MAQNKDILDMGDKQRQKSNAKVRQKGSVAQCRGRAGRIHHKCRANNAVSAHRGRSAQLVFLPSGAHVGDKMIYQIKMMSWCAFRQQKELEADAALPWV